jgi:sigma-B regulation protein RsbU (phosphoserine phosphatase)
MERAGRVQRSLLPDVSSTLEDYRVATLYRPCEALGGDFYDLVRHRDCMVVMVSDVMGHGAEAALITMLLKAVFQDVAASASEPDALLSEMNERLHRMIPQGVFAAAAVARLGLNGSGVRFANAGLPYPFVLRAAQRRVEQVQVAGLPLGLFGADRNGAYDVCNLTLGPGDVLLIASDGIGSIEGDKGECFEDRRLGQALAGLTGHEGKQVIDSLVAEAVDFGHGRPLLDDINLVAVWREGRHKKA